MRLGFPLLLYLAASLLHFAHNAEYLADYPNLPAWLTPSGIYLTWIAQAAVGIGGFVLYSAGWQIPGLILIGLYSAFGFDGLLHYSRAPLDAHSFGMNFTIWFEVAAAAILLSTVVYQLARRR
jgi:hypothetical protein